MNKILLASIRVLMPLLSIKSFKWIQIGSLPKSGYFSWSCKGYEFCLEPSLKGIWRLSFCDDNEEVLIEENHPSRESALKQINELYTNLLDLKII